jgi:Cu(I)/Ag(I) efflux system membrane protein CusA/SilA
LVVPFVLLVIFVLLFLTFQRVDDALLIMLSCRFRWLGGFWFIYALGHNLSVAVRWGSSRSAGVAAEFGVVMLLYLRQAVEAPRRGTSHGGDRRRGSASACGPRQ